MFRTRDFLLYLLAVGFLVVAIVYTAGSGIASDSQSWWSQNNFNSEEVAYTAVAPENKNVEPDRNQNLQAMKKKIAQVGIDSNLASVIAAVPDKVEEESEENIIEDNNTPGEILKCAHYSVSSMAWLPQGLKFEVVEGARIVFREANMSASGEGFSQGLGQEIVLQLPLRSIASVSKNCLPQDVVGIALDGSLLRNNENGMYSIFGKETLVGYALDGFPVHGLNDTAKTDVCGGMVEDGQYRYYLSSTREGVIGCFAGEPVSL